MPRQLRHHVPGGWCHLTARGIGRCTIFETDRDREHFLELLSGMVERYGVVLHAYVLMGNHYHLLVESPEGNVKGCYGTRAETRAEMPVPVVWPVRAQAVA